MGDDLVALGLCEAVHCGAVWGSGICLSMAAGRQTQKERSPISESPSEAHSHWSMTFLQSLPFQDSTSLL